MKFSKIENNNLFRIVFFLISFFLALYVIVRAYHMSFTHDESLTYQTVKGLPDFEHTANNHLANTFLTKISAAIFGFSEFALRLPNVLVFIIYLYFVYKLFFKATSLTLLVLPFLLLNPFVLDFFSLSRGYGLATAFFTGSVYYFIQHITLRNAKYLAYALAMSVLCVYANFSFLTAILSLHLACFFFYVRNRQFDLKVTPLLYLLELGALFPSYVYIKELQESGQLYFGGDKNIIEDSFYSIIKCSFQIDLLGKTNLIILFSALLVYVLSLLIKKNEELRYVLVSTAISIAVPVLLNALTGMKFPIERSILYLPILMGFCVLYAVEAAKEDGYKLVKYPLLLLVASLSLLHIVNFCLTANITSTYTWAYDANTKDMLKVLQTKIEPEKTYKLGCTWLCEPAVNYYRETKNYTWLQPVVRYNLAEKSDYYYVVADDGDYKPNGCQIEIQRFPEAKSRLLKEVKDCWNK